MMMMMLSSGTAFEMMASNTTNSLPLAQSSDLRPQISLSISRAKQTQGKPILSLDYSNKGDLLVAAGLDDSVRLYSVDTAEYP